MPLTCITAPSIEPITIAEAKRQVRLGTSAGEPAPTAPTVALASPAAPGNCDNGAHRVGVTFVTADGETEIGPLSDVVTVADKTVNGQIAVSSLALGGAAVTSRKLYLVPVAGGAAKYAAIVANNTATTATLNVADSALGAEAPTTNTTEDPALQLAIQAARERCEKETGRALLTQTWDLVLDSFPDEWSAARRSTWIDVPLSPLQSITSITYRDVDGVTQTWAAANYLVTNAYTKPVLNARPARGRISTAYGVSWPTTRGLPGDVTIRLVCGYGDAASAVPGILRAAMLLDIATLYADRENLIKGASVAELPGGRRGIYWSYRSHPDERQVA